MEPALFSPALLFGQEESDEDLTTSLNQCEFVERSHEFPGITLQIREFAFHQVNANLLWPGTLLFAKWLVEHDSLLKGRQIIELGSGTGALAIYLKKMYAMDITTSDFDDEVVEENILHNCKANDVVPMQHIRHTWGDTFPVNSSRWDLILASDILLYVKQYPNLIKTVLFLLQNYSIKSDSTCYSGIGNTSNENCISHDYSTTFKVESVAPDSKSLLEFTQLPKPCFLMSWRRRLPKEEEGLFFNGCKESGLFVHLLGSRVYCISSSNMITSHIQQ